MKARLAALLNLQISLVAFKFAYTFSLFLDLQASQYDRSCYSGDTFPFWTDNFYDHDFRNSGRNFDCPTL